MSQFYRNYLAWRFDWFSPFPFETVIKICTRLSQFIPNIRIGKYTVAKTNHRKQKGRISFVKNVNWLIYILSSFCRLVKANEYTWILRIWGWVDFFLYKSYYLSRSWVSKKRISYLFPKGIYVKVSPIPSLYHYTIRASNLTAPGIHNRTPRSTLLNFFFVCNMAVSPIGM